MRSYQWLPASIVAAAFLVGSASQSARAEKHPGKPTTGFGSLTTMPSSEARHQVDAWLLQVGKTDETTQKAVQTIWNSDRPLLDKIAEILSLADPAAAKLLAEARNPLAAAPLDLPAVFKNPQLPLFYRANLALAYARALSARRIYEESLAVVQYFRPEQVVDPAAYLFHRAVAEHALIRKKEAERSITRLLEDVINPPSRYRSLAELMSADMASWQDKDLGWIARKMHNSERRLTLARGGPRTQKIQKEALVQLDKMIRELEQRQGGQQGGGPGGMPGSNPQSNSPQSDSYGGNAPGSGNVDFRRFKETAQVWGKLPEKERAEAMLELSREIPARYREVIENYFKELARRSDADRWDRRR